MTAVMAFCFPNDLLKSGSLRPDEIVLKKALLTKIMFGGIPNHPFSFSFVITLNSYFKLYYENKPFNHSAG